jgi:excisionase family DNA binding protein
MVLRREPVLERAATVMERLAEGTPLRLGEFAKMIGYSREQVRKWVDAGQIETVRPIEGAERRIPANEAERVCRDLRIIEFPPT